MVLSAPAANLTERATDFYDRTAAFALGGNAGVVWQVSDHVGAFGQIGLRWMSGLSEIDDLAGTGLETINDDSSRWTLPVVVGMRVDSDLARANRHQPPEAPRSRRGGPEPVAFVFRARPPAALAWHQRIRA